MLRKVKNFSAKTRFRKLNTELRLAQKEITD
jgi:hypothetical protein